jgi:hypothetical protein
MNYTEADQILGNLDSKKIHYQTYLIRHYNNTISIRLYATDIIVFHPDNSFQLYTNGWNTVLTRRRMNMYIPVGHVYTDRSELYFNFPNKYIFHEGMKVYEDGSTNAKSYRFELFRKAFHTEIKSDKDILNHASKMSLIEHQKLWRRKRSMEFRNYFVIYLPTEILPLILPTARGSEHWYNMALQRLQKTDSN